MSYTHNITNLFKRVNKKYKNCLNKFQFLVLSIVESINILIVNPDHAVQMNSIPGRLRSTAMPKAKYEPIYRSIREDIETGKLGYGDFLPSENDYTEPPTKTVRSSPSAGSKALPRQPAAIRKRSSQESNPSKSLKRTKR